MQKELKNGHRFWLSSEGNAISNWNINNGTNWFISSSLYVPIMDPSKECPHDNLQSNWRYFDLTKKVLHVDVLNSIKVNCIRGKLDFL